MVLTVNELKTRIAPIAAQYGLKAVYLFGSYARNEATDDSDVDILTGQNAGMLTVGCAWGFRGRACLESVHADIIADHPSDLSGIFGGVRP